MVYDFKLIVKSFENVRLILLLVLGYYYKFLILFDVKRVVKSAANIVII